jgi:outer membrane protein OmpA-like peptidoglycan-associated protein
MKSSTYFIALLTFVCMSFKVQAQHPTELAPGYYIVVGAYAPGRENVAQNYTDVLSRRGFNAGYGFNSGKKFFFVYLKYFTDLKSSLKDMQNTRKQEEFAQAWVRVVPGDLTAQRSNVSTSKVLQESVTVSNNAVPQIRSEEKSVPKTDTPVKNVAPVMEVENKKNEPLSAPASDGIAVTDNPEIVQYEHMTLGNTEVFLSLYNARNNRIVEGMVKVVDTDRVQLIKEVKGNEYLLLPDPKSNSGQLSLICEAFGYRKVQQQINYPLPLADTVKDFVDLMGTTLVINFDLIRYHRGDIATLYHVYFYNDAALMLPESKFELNSLLQMMQEEPKYKIRLHGHTNGNYHGRIITVGDAKNFFSLDGSKNSVGSAKDLSYNRAEVIKEFLITNGIDPARIEIKAWGGKKPIFDKHSVNAKRNVRVEVEILND